MNAIELKKLWQKDENADFQGWDFSYLNNRWESEPLPWDYKALVQEHLNPHDTLLDIGTGGGEFLLSLRHPYVKTAVTEISEAKFTLCEKKLSPLGIHVHQVYDTQLPFGDHTFDIVLNRHAPYDAAEIKRVLKPDGIFITQQVGGNNNADLSKRLKKDYASPYLNWNLAYASRQLKNNGFDLLIKNEHYPYLRFFDVGAIVYFAKIIQWEFPNFSVERCFDTLHDMHRELKAKPYIQSTQHRFVIAARNKEEAL